VTTQTIADTTPAAATTAATGDQLPFTGMALWQPLVIGALLALLGLGLRRTASPRMR
jgi:hypothetical protein